jgi:heterotetrameric sarcosine oxidase gamma subunit
LPGGGGELTLTDASSAAKWLVRAGTEGPTVDRLGARFGTSQVAPSGALVLGARPGEWIILGTPAEVAATVADLDGLDAQEFCSALDWTHSRAMFRLTGHDAPRMLEKVCGIDWGDHMTPDGAVVSASVALTTCDLARNDSGGVRSYLIFCDRSFGQYLFDALIDAGNEFGLTVTASSAS